jgi:predicted dehydrogenase
MNISTRPLRGVVCGAGFWAEFQVPAWREVEGVRITAITNRTRSKAEVLARRFGVPGVYDTLEEMLDKERPDFLDIITEVPAHRVQVLTAARRGIAVFCQKPMGQGYAECEEMVAACASAGVPFWVHENYRWVSPFRAVKELLDAGRIGTPRRAQITLASATREMYDAQPASKNYPHSILTDMGCHVFDLCRFYFGEPLSVYAHAMRRWEDYPCESIMTAVLRYPSMVCTTALSERIGSRLFIDGDGGSVELMCDNSIKIITASGTWAVAPSPVPSYPWITEQQRRDYGNTCSQAIIDCHRHLAAALRTGARAETEAKHYLKTMRLVYAAVESTVHNRVVEVED